MASPFYHTTRDNVSSSDNEEFSLSSLDLDTLDNSSCSDYLHYPNDNIDLSLDSLLAENKIVIDKENTILNFDTCSHKLAEQDPLTTHSPSLSDHSNMTFSTLPMDMETTPKSIRGKRMVKHKDGSMHVALVDYFKDSNDDNPSETNESTDAPKRNRRTLDSKVLQSSQKDTERFEILVGQHSERITQIAINKLDGFKANVHFLVSRTISFSLYAAKIT